MGVIIALIIGGLIGWLAARVIGSEEGMFGSVVIGMLGAITGNLLSEVIGSSSGNLMGLSWTGIMWMLIGSLLFSIVLNAFQHIHGSNSF